MKEKEKETWHQYRFTQKTQKPKKRTLPSTINPSSKRTRPRILLLAPHTAEY